jgi:hypothetical protein
MGNEPACLQGEDEIVGGCGIPLGKSFPFRKTIKGNVQLDRGKASAIIFDPMVF